MPRLIDDSTGERALPEFVDKDGFEHYREVRMYGHVFGWGSEKNSIEQVLFRDGKEFCRRPGWDSGFPCIFHPNINALAGTRARTMSVLISLVKRVGSSLR